MNIEDLPESLRRGWLYACNPTDIVPYLVSLSRAFLDDLAALHAMLHAHSGPSSGAGKRLEKF